MPRKKKIEPKVQDNQVPEFFLVGGHRIEVDVDPKMGDLLHGSYLNKKIKINPFMDEIEQTIFHELLHAALDISGQNEHLEDNQEEAIIKAIEMMIGHLITVKGVNL